MGDGADDLYYREIMPHKRVEKLFDEIDITNEALKESMKIFGEALENNKHIEQPYRTKCIVKIFNGCVEAVYIKGMIADVEIHTAEGIERITSGPWGNLD